MAFPGPRELGRGIVLRPGQPVPEPCLHWPEVVVESLDAVDALHGHWLRREPVVVRLAVDPAWLRTPETDDREPWEVGPRFEFTRERLQFLVWMNNWDGRDGEPVWWWDRKAARLGPTSAWIDGGPRQPLSIPVVHRESVELGRLAPARYQDPTADLAPDQRAAVCHPVGPARVIAPAGSGKTRVLTERLRHLLADRQWEPATVVALAYNKRAADEMVERVPDLPARVRTLNSLGLALCNGGGRRDVIDETAVRTILDQLIELPRALNTDPYVAYLEGLRAVRLGLQDPSRAEVAFDAPGLADLFTRYNRALDDKRVIDFDGQLYEAVRVLLRDPQARGVAHHLLVDEFQDLTPTHVLLLRLLAAPAYDVFGVGDDDQVIYGFGGASPEFLIGYEGLFPGATPYALEVNYRCSPRVITAAQTLLSYSPRRIAKSVVPAPDREAGDDDLRLELVDALRAAEVTADVLERWHDEGTPYEELAALARVNSALLPVQVTLVERGVPCRQPLDASILSRTGLRCALAYVRIALDPGSIAPADIGETIRRPSRRIARNVVELLTRSRSSSLSDIRRLAGRLQGGDARKLESYADDLERLAAVADDAVALVRAIRLDIGLGSAMDVLDGSRREADRSTHADDLIALEQAAALHPEAATLEAWLRDVLRRRPADGPGVELSTVHRVKGREWDGVVVFGVDDELLPHRLAHDEAEERRLLHVAVTRGRHKVVLVADREHPSPFLAELAGVRSRTPTPRPVRRVAATPVATVEPNARVVEAIKAWRRETAARDGVPAYVVLNDKDVDAIAARAPRSLEELAGCRGIGAVRLERFGDELLSVIEEASA